ncbi:MAG: LOG family protein [bacterium]
MSKEKTEFDMESAPPKLEKAYDNREFLHSPDARTVRVLTEYLEPQARLRRRNVSGTIVFFGSARALPSDEVQPLLGEAEERVSQIGDRQALEALGKARGAARHSRYYEDAVELARKLTEFYQKQPHPRDRLVVCSGGGPGIMEAANRGARQADGKTVGFCISLPQEQSANRWLLPELTFEFHYFFMRKYWFVYLARALVIFPGGFGTMDELFEVLTLIQTQKLKKRLPIVLYGSEYWNDVIDFKAMVKWMVVSPKDLELFKICDTPEHAFEFLTSRILSGANQELQESPTE